MASQIVEERLAIEAGLTTAEDVLDLLHFETGLFKIEGGFEIRRALDGISTMLYVIQGLGDVISQIDSEQDVRTIGDAVEILTAVTKGVVDSLSKSVASQGRQGAST